MLISNSQISFILFGTLIASKLTKFNALTTLKAVSWQFYFQAPETPVMEGIVYFHDIVMFLITFTVFFIGALLFRCLDLFVDKNCGRIPEKFVHHILLEVFWTLLPAFFILCLSVPSFSLLYAMDEVPDSYCSLKCIGHQWYWSYELVDHKGGL